MRNILWITVLCLFATGCVSKKAHNAEVQKLEQELQSTSKDRGQLKASLEETRRALAEMQKREEEQKKRLKEFNELTQRFKRLIDAGTLSVRIVDGKMVVSLGSDVLFPSGSAKLSEKGMQTIKDVTAQLVSITDKKYQVEGHTDNVPIKTAAFPTNWELASTRALTVTKTMIENGMPSDRVSAASFGDTHPVAANDTAENKALNRRIEIVIVPDLSSLPGYEELQKYSVEPAPAKPSATKEAPAKKTEAK
jgi:chemotaxis protein MotB